MKETIIATLIGGLVASLPVILTSTVSIVSSFASRKHELKLKRVELVDSAKIEIIRRFSDALGNCMSLEDTADADRKSAVLSEYLACYERLSLYVGDRTYSAMEKVADPFGYDPSHKYVIELNRCLRNEMQSVFSSGKKPTRNRNPK